MWPLLVLKSRAIMTTNEWALKAEKSAVVKRLDAMAEAGRAFVGQRCGGLDELEALTARGRDWQVTLMRDFADFFSALPIDRVRFAPVRAYERPFFPLFEETDVELTRFRKEVRQNLDGLVVLIDMVKRVKATPRALQPSRAPNVDSSGKKSVFVVHGRDNEMKEAAGRLIASCGLKEVILSEQASVGRTIIEKFEHHANVDYAVVLFSPDDSVVNADGSSVMHPRLNVMFELGYFVGRLGRRRVVVIHRGNVEVLSDYHGVMRIPFDAVEAWKPRLVQELTSAGLISAGTVARRP